MEKTIQLFSGTGQPISGNICTMTEEHLHEVQTIWEPMLVATQQPDEGWGWAYKLRQSQQEQRYDTYAIEAEDFTQGILFIETQWHRSQLNSKNPLVYVEAMSSAPWNRKSIEDPPFCQDIGRNLLLIARLRSVALGYQGRVGLHSLPRAEGFYRRIQMPEYGEDREKEGLVYFEYGIL